MLNKFLLNAMLARRLCLLACLLMPLQFLAAQQYDFFAGFEDQHTEEMFESAYPEIKTDYSILHNQFYHDERLRIYNYTAYQTDQLNQKVLTGDTMSFGLNDLSISIGYGIVYQINQDNRIGYEYLSSFPFDRGQMVRLFWLRVL